MSNTLDLRHFLRRAPRDWLKRYFDRAGLLSDFDWSALDKHKIDPLLERLGELPQDKHRQVVQDFLDIKLLATPSGKTQIIDEAAFFGIQDEVSAKLLELGDFYACAFWVMLDMRQCWEGALRYASADGKSKRYWCKRINMPKLGRHPTERDGQALAGALTQLFTKTEGRGGNCVVHIYRRGADARREYYFAYPEGHRHTPLVFEKGELTVRRRRRAMRVTSTYAGHVRVMSGPP
jgi:hypothetical protein